MRVGRDVLSRGGQHEKNVLGRTDRSDVHCEFGCRGADAGDRPADRIANTVTFTECSKSNHGDWMRAKRLGHGHSRRDRH
jgi:hypothetical protein